MGLYDSNSGFVDGQRPDDSYNVTNPQANLPQPSLRAAAFRKNLDAQGRQIDLNKMPAETTQVYNDNASDQMQFEVGVPGAHRAMVKKDVADQIADGQKIDPVTGTKYKAPLRAYNHATNEYFQMERSAPAISRDKVAEWTKRINEQNTATADIAEKKRVGEQSTLGNERKYQQEQFNNTQAALTNASAIKVAEAASAAGVTRLNTVTDIMSAEGQAKLAAMPEARFQDFVEGIPDGAAKDAAIKVWAAKNGVVADPAEAAKEKADKGVAKLLADLARGGDSVINPTLSGPTNNILAEISAGNLDAPGSASGNSVLISAKGKLNSLVSQFAAANGISADQVRPLIMSKVGLSIGATNKNYNEIMAFLNSETWTPAAPKTTWSGRPITQPPTATGVPPMIAAPNAATSWSPKQLNNAGQI